MAHSDSSNSRYHTRTVCPRQFGLDCGDLECEYDGCDPARTVVANYDRQARLAEWDAYEARAREGNHSTSDTGRSGYNRNHNESYTHVGASRSNAPDQNRYIDYEVEEPDSDDPSTTNRRRKNRQEHGRLLLEAAPGAFRHSSHGATTQAGGSSSEYGDRSDASSFPTAGGHQSWSRNVHGRRRENGDRSQKGGRRTRHAPSASRPDPEAI